MTSWGNSSRESSALVTSHPHLKPLPYTEVTGNFDEPLPSNPNHIRVPAHLRIPGPDEAYRAAPVAKAVLATMARGARLELLVDDPRAGSDIPRAAESEGHAVVELGPAGTARPVVTRIVIER